MSRVNPHWVTSLVIHRWISLESSTYPFYCQQVMLLMKESCQSSSSHGSCYSSMNLTGKWHIPILLSTGHVTHEWVVAIIFESRVMLFINESQRDVSPTHSIVNRWIPYGVAIIRRIDKMICLFCRILSLLQGSFAKQACILSILLTETTP